MNFSGLPNGPEFLQNLATIVRSGDGWFDTLEVKWGDRRDWDGEGQVELSLRILLPPKVYVECLNNSIPPAESANKQVEVTKRVTRLITFEDDENVSQ